MFVVRNQECCLIFLQTAEDAVDGTLNLANSAVSAAEAVLDLATAALNVSTFKTLSFLINITGNRKNYNSDCEFPS